jgi:hypothetical protein
MSEYQIGKEMALLEARIQAVEQYILQQIEAEKKPKNFQEFKKEKEGN